MPSAAELKIGLSIAKKIFAPKGGNPQLAISSANRELLTELHSRLDLIEEGVAEILTRVVTLRREIYEDSLEAQEYALGRRILGIGQLFIADRMNLLRMEQDPAIQAEDMARETRIYRKNLEDWLFELRMAWADLNTRAGSLSVGALTNVVAAYIELGIRIEQRVRFGRSRHSLHDAARLAIRQFDKILDDAPAQQSLGHVLAETEAALGVRFAKMGWDQTLDLKNQAFFEGRIVSKVFGEQITWDEPAPYDPDDPAFVRGEDLTYVDVDRVFVVRLTTEVDNDGRRQFGITDETVEAPISEYLRPASSGSGILVSTIQGTRRYSDMRDQYKNWLMNFGRLYTLWENLQSMRATVKQAKTAVEGIIEGDYSSIFEDGLFTVDDLEIDDLHGIMLAAEEAEALEDVAAYQEALKAGQTRVASMIRLQNKKIAAEFDAAAKAARTNQLIGLLEMGLMLYQMYERSDTRARDAKATAEKMVDTASRLEAAPDRGPASTAVVRGLNSAAQQLAWWGGMLNAKRQGEAMSAAIRQIQMTIPEGEIHEYRVIAKGTRFHLLIPAATPQIYDGTNTKPIGTVMIEGTKR